MFVMSQLSTILFSILIVHARLTCASFSCPKTIQDDYNKVCEATKDNASAGYISSGLRSSASILITAVAVYFACPWSIIRFNVPDRKRSMWKRGYWYYNFVATTVAAPEITAVMALFEYIAAHQNCVAMQALGAGQWTLTHGFMANMGGMVLRSEGLAPFIVTGRMIEVLVKEGVIDVPDIDEDDIADKSKADAVAKVLVISQALWLVVTTVARKVDGLGVAPIEMTACLHFMVSLMTYSLQWKKPQGVLVPLEITVPIALDESVVSQLKAIADLKEDQELSSVRTVSHMSALFNVDERRDLTRLICGLVYISATAIISRAIQIAYAHSLFTLNSTGRMFKNANIAALVFQLCMPAALILLSRWLWAFFLLYYGLVFSMGLAIGVAIPETFGGFPSVSVPLRWADWFPHI